MIPSSSAADRRHKISILGRGISRGSRHPHRRDLRCKQRICHEPEVPSSYRLKDGNRRCPTCGARWQQGNAGSGESGAAERLGHRAHRRNLVEGKRNVRLLKPVQHYNVRRAPPYANASKYDLIRGMSQWTWGSASEKQSN